MPIAAGYREWAPPPALRPALACLWSSRPPDQPDSAAVPRGQATLVLPDGCADLIWTQGGRAFVAGPDTGPVPALLSPGAVLVGLRFRPGAGGDLLGVPLSELRDRRVDLAELRPELAGSLSPDLAAGQVAARLAALAGQLITDRPPDPAALAACRLLARPGSRAEDVAEAVGLSTRQLRRRCQAAVGYGPKMLQRVLRFRRFVSIIDASAGTADLAGAATASGYADQPHLTRDTVELAGLPPAALIRARHPGVRLPGARVG
ncbi:MAG TPA: helix-turn-helix domain-containing protein [Streptosporangiaceae bacterium]